MKKENNNSNFLHYSENMKNFEAFISGVFCRIETLKWLKSGDRLSKKNNSSLFFFSNQIFTNLTIGIFWMYVILTYKTNVSSPVVGSPQRGLEQRLYVFLWIKKTPKGYFRDFHKVRPFILCKSEPFIVIC